MVMESRDPVPPRFAIHEFVDLYCAQPGPAIGFLANLAQAACICPLKATFDAVAGDGEPKTNPTSLP
jgi:hypothetical protein